MYFFKRGEIQMPAEVKNGEPLKLTIANYWQELETAIKEKRMPAALVDSLKMVISAYQNNGVGPTATAHLIGLAKELVPNGICLQYGHADENFDIVVFVPDQLEESDDLRMFFVLIPRYRNGRFKYLYQF
jgi:hypothetical protein